jgi:membrane protein YqaA with SNARE-associated domain
MKHFFTSLLTKYKYLVALALKFGAPGLFVVAFVDASSIAVPMDPLVASYVWAQPHKLVLYVLMAGFGSALGSLVPFFLGRAGGELFLLKRIDRKRFEQLRDRFERQEFLALLVPAMLPPPTPFKLFVFAAGVFEMKALPFLLAVFVGRVVRFGVLSLLVIRYGPQIVHVLGHAMHRHLTATLIVFGMVVAFGTWLVARQVIASKKRLV